LIKIYVEDCFVSRMAMLSESLFAAIIFQ